MADYRPLISDDDLEKAPFRPDLRNRFNDICAFFTRSRQTVRLYRRVIIALITAPLVIMILHANRDSIRTLSTTDGPHVSLLQEHFEYLSSPLTGYDVNNERNESTYIVGEHHSVSGDFPIDYQWIDPATAKPFAKITGRNGMNNNAMGRMPVGSPYDMLVVGRGKSDVYTDQTEHISYVNLTIVGFFANYNAATGEWHRAGPEPYILDIPIWRTYPRPCDNLVNGGPADPRFIWSDAGEPLAIIGTSSRVPGICKAIGLVDLRAVWPGLKVHLEEIGYGDIPIKFDHFTEIGNNKVKSLYEKNWAAFYPGPKPFTSSMSWVWRGFKSWRANLAEPSWPMFATQIKTRSILKVNETLDVSQRSQDSYVLADEVDLSSRINGTLVSADSTCILKSLPEHWVANKLHQATPFHRVTFCPRDSCIPSRENTVLLGLIHYKKSNKSYRRMFVTMSTEQPFKILSVSPPLHFGSKEIDEEVVFSVSLAFLPTKNPTDLVAGETPFKKSQDPPGGYLSHGWLNDTLVVGAGLRNEVYDGIHLPISAALQGHTLCD